MNSLIHTVGRTFATAVAAVSILLGTFAPALGAPADARDSRTERITPAKNLILVVADGLGPHALGLLVAYRRWKGETCYLESMLRKGKVALVQARAPNALVTDSASSATALATGYVAPPLYVGGTEEKGADGTQVFKDRVTLLEAAQSAGRSTGLVTTSRITHATPASFAAETESRGEEALIARQLLEQEVDVLLGGGIRYFLHEEFTGSTVVHRGKVFHFSPFVAATELKKRRAESNLIGEFLVKGYRVVDNRKGLLESRKADRLLGLFSSSHMPYVLDVQNRHVQLPVPSLREMTDVALTVLSRNRRGFFLMVEAARVDHAEHGMDLASLLQELRDLDEMLKVVQSFASDREDTLVVVTSDHDTGSPGFMDNVDGLDALQTLVDHEINWVEPDVFERIEGQRASFDRLSLDVAAVMPRKPGEEDTPKISVFPWFSTEEELAPYGVDPTDDHATALRKVIERTPKPEFETVAAILNQYLHPECALSTDEAGQIFTVPQQSHLYPGASGAFEGNLSRILGRCYEATWSGPGHSSAPVPTLLLGPAAESAPGFLYNDELGKFLFRASGLPWR